MNYETQRINAELAISKVLSYPYKVATKRNGSIPRPEEYTKEFNES